MNTNFEKEAVEDLRRRKKSLRTFTRSLSPTEKIRQLELLQQRYYKLLKAREESGGREIPDKWRKWRDAKNNSPHNC